MRPSTRLFELIQILRGATGPITAAALAASLEVAARTVLSRHRRVAAHADRGSRRDRLSAAPRLRPAAPGIHPGRTRRAVGGLAPVGQAGRCRPGAGGQSAPPPSSPAPLPLTPRTPPCRYPTGPARRRPRHGPRRHPRGAGSLHRLSRHASHRHDPHRPAPGADLLRGRHRRLVPAAPGVPPLPRRPHLRPRAPPGHVASRAASRSRRRPTMLPMPSPVRSAAFSPPFTRPTPRSGRWRRDRDHIVA